MVEIERKEKPLPSELALIAAIFSTAKTDYLASWRKIQSAGGIEYLQNKYNEAKSLIKKYNKSVNNIKKYNACILDYNRNNINKKEAIPIPKESEEVLNAKKYIEKYANIVKYADEVEIFMKSKWFENLAIYAGLEPSFIKNQFHKLKDEIIEPINV